MTSPRLETANPVSLVFEHVLEARRRALFQRGARVLDLASIAWTDGDGPFDAAFGDWTSLDAAQLAALGRRMAQALRPGAAVLLAFSGPWPLPILLRRALLGVGPGLGRTRARIEGHAPWGRSAREVREQLGGAFAWRDAFGIGILMPGPGQALWVQRRPQAFGLLAAAEHVVRHWPLLRSLGERIVIEGIRR